MRCTEQGGLKQSQANSELKENKIRRDRGSQSLQGRALEKKETHRERAPEICRGSPSSIQKSTARRVHGREPPESIRGRTSGAHIWQGRVPVPNGQTGKLHNSWNSRYSKSLTSFFKKNQTQNYHVIQQSHLLVYVQKNKNRTLSRYLHSHVH